MVLPTKSVRFARRVPTELWMLLGALFVFGLLYAPFLCSDRILASGDNLGFIYPFFQSLRPFSLSSMLADPLVGRGFPWIVTYGTIDPLLHLLRLLTDPYRMLAWLTYLSLSGGAFFFALFLRRGGRSALASFVGGIAFAAASWVAFGDHSPALGVFLFAASLFTTRHSRSHPIATAIVLSLLTAYLWFSVHYNYALLCMMGVGVYAAFASWEGSDSLWKRLLPLRLWAISLAVGTALGLLKLLPAFAYVQLSERSGGYSLAEASVDRLSFSLFYNSLFPYIELPLMTNTGVGALYGATGLTLLILGMWAGGRKILPVATAWFLTLLIGLPHSPVFWIAYHIPFVKFLHGPSRYLFIGHAAAAVIIAVAFDRVTTGDWRSQRRAVGTVFLWIGGLFSLVGFFLTVPQSFGMRALIRLSQAYFDTHLLSQTSGLPLEHYHAYIESAWQQLFQSFSLLSPVFVVPLLLTLCAGWMFRWGFDRWNAQTTRTLLALLAVTGSVWGLFFYHPRARRSDLAEVQALTAIDALHEEYVLPVMPGLADFLQRSKAFGEDPSQRLRYQLGLLMPNRHALLGIPSLDFYQPLQPTRMSRLLAALGSNAAIAPEGEHLFSASLSLEEKMRAIAKRKELLAMLNVHALVSVWELPPPFEYLTSYQPVAGRQPPILVYRVPHPRPHVYVPASVQQFPPNEDRAIFLLKDLQSPALSTIECVACPAASALPQAVRIAEEVREPLRERFFVMADEDTWVVVSRLRLPGWRVFIDGAPVKTAIANSLFFGIPVPAGEHRVDIRMTYGFLLQDSIESVLKGKDPWLL